MSLELRARAAIARMEVFAYNPLQPRGPDGRWIKAGAGAPSAPSAPKKAARSRAPRKAAPARARASEWLSEAKKGKLSAATQQQIRDAFAFADPGTGIRAEAKTVEPTGTDSVQVSVDMYDQDNRWVGRAMRTISPSKTDPSKSSIYHTSFQLAPRAQGGGFSSRWLRQMEDRYRDQGIDEIALTTNDVGGYAWAKAGFDFADAGQARQMADRFELRSEAPTSVYGDSDQAKQQMRELAARARSTNPDDHPLPIEFAMVGWEPGATSWPGKDAMIGTAWEGVKKL